MIRITNNEEFWLCPYCGNELFDQWSVCCGEQHAERAWSVFIDGEEFPMAESDIPEYVFIEFLARKG